MVTITLTLQAKGRNANTRVYYLLYICDTAMCSHFKLFMMQSSIVWIVVNIIFYVAAKMNLICFYLLYWYPCPGHVCFRHSVFSKRMWPNSFYKRKSRFDCRWHWAFERYKEIIEIKTYRRLDLCRSNLYTIDFHVQIHTQRKLKTINTVKPAIEDTSI